MRRIRSLCVALAFVLPLSAAAAKTAQVPGAAVTYDGITLEQATAIARTLAAARTVYADEFKFDMPQSIAADVTVGPGNPTRLFNDGRDHVSLSLASADALARPEKSGVFNLYGLCHELGHVAMYRTLTDRDWLTGAAMEGWAHYAGSVVVDRVWKSQGKPLWSDQYDYSGDGTPRLSRQLSAASPSDIDRAAGLWRDLTAITGGPETTPALFAAWQKAAPDLAAADKKLLPALLETFPADKRAALEKWWQSAAPVLVRSHANSAFAKSEIEPSKLEGKPITLKFDDDTADGKRSVAGGGHARLFEAPAEGEWYLRAVSVHGARYGASAPPPDKFDVALCDAEMHPIAVWQYPYAAFDRGQAKWVTVTMPKATRVPAQFNVCLVFRPSALSGVFVDYDASTHDHSRTATAGGQGTPLPQGDWMIRVELDRAKGATALDKR